MWTKQAKKPTLDCEQGLITSAGEIENVVDEGVILLSIVHDSVWSESFSDHLCMCSLYNK